MKTTTEAWCIWAGPLSLALFITAMSFTGSAFPMTSTLRPEEVVALYQAHVIGIRRAGMLFVCCGAFMMIFAGYISAALYRIEGRCSSWTFIQAIGGIMGNLPFVLTGVLWSVIAFRLDRPPGVTQGLNDVAWFLLEIPGPTASIQFLAIAAVVLGDKSRQPILPRWVGYLNILAIILFLPGVAAGVFVGCQSMDWNGFVTYLMPGLASAGWIVLMAYALWRGRNQQPARP